MTLDFSKEVQLYMIFDSLGDIERTGPILWNINRFRLEDVKNHVLDIIIVIRLLQRYFPSGIDYDLMIDYALVHDLPEALTGDITDFEGVSKEEKNAANDRAICWLTEKFNSVLDFKKLFSEYEEQITFEAKIVHMIDKIQASIVFLKYQLENIVDMEDPRVPKTLRNHPFVIQKLNEGKDLGDIFFEFHKMSVDISDEECQKYNIEREKADTIVSVIKSFIDEIYRNKKAKTLLVDINEFPSDALIYNRRNEL